ncbi:hypothetical protein GCG54_00005855 [Colletotrichum gloeosporioides]|uniref:C2H2-type domain-containing protein n=1 Tax=Colletotrichum gloeosporioides TaxID=474922 RepID=A0A8H4CJU3_COLGL|nr:uncharacterized protein GCG54_00005855 [Colletotrichum gloeosporioides]KAF3805109.1 hypothetical protein GCG54_00005855 [Colletotrichum gloeosporioides]
MADPFKGAVILLPDGRVVRARDLAPANIGPAVLHDEALKNALRQLRTPLPDGPRNSPSNIVTSGPSSQAENLINQTSTTGNERGANADPSSNANTRTTTHQSTSRRPSGRPHTLVCVHCNKSFSRNDTVRLHLINAHYKKDTPGITNEEAQAKSRQEAP